MVGNCYKISCNRSKISNRQSYKTSKKWCKTHYSDICQLYKTKIEVMNVKRIFGSLLTVLGIIGLIYAAYVFATTGGETRDIKALAIYGILGVIFFFAGISLVRNTKDES